MIGNAGEKLDFGRVVALIANETLSEPAKSRTAELAPFSIVSDAILQMERIAALRQLFERNSQFPIEPFEDIRTDLKRCRIKGSFLPVEVLVRIIAILRQSKNLRQYHQQNKELLRPLSGLMIKINPLDQQYRQIQRVINDEGLVKDTASPDLARIRKQIHQTVLHLQREIDRVMLQARKEGWLHEDNATIRDGRFVLPLRSESKRKVKGIIHGQSATGATSYIEPLSVVEINNSLKELEIEETAEIQRILQALTDELRPFFDDLELNVEILVELDFLSACARFSRRFKCTVPKISSDDRRIILKNARHPVLSLVKKVIPLNVSIDSQTHCVIITGPNAGGKTVAMKTIGLLGIMAASGLPIPADDDSRLPCFDQFLIDIGDQQSLEDDLSTFTSHVANLKQFVMSATDKSLVLIDELGTGTDPLEGAALGQAVLEELTVRKTFCVVTTHHSGLKAFADKFDGVMNAAMEFDTDRLIPTYRLQLGLPGSSYALEIAKRMGLDDSVIQRARDLMGTDQVKLENLLLEVETLKSQIEKENRSVQQNKKTLDKLITEYESKVSSIREKHDDMDQKIAEELERLVKESRSKIEHVVKDIREKVASRETIIEAQKTLENIKKVASKRIPKKQKTVAQKITGNIAVNSWVTVDGISGMGQVVEIQDNKKKAAVSINGKLLWVTLGSLHPAKKEQKLTEPRAIIGVQSSEIASYKLDLRGMRLEEARDALERFIDRALLSGLNQIQIVHGKGTGALQKMTHDVLKSTPGIRKFNFENFDRGGTGATIVEL